MGNEITHTYLNILNHGGNLKDLNHTFIALIPKIKDPNRMVDYRPISLCNVVYKLISKSLANQLKKIIDDIISPNQLAFILKRLISDNVLVDFECIHKINNKTYGGEGALMLKLNMNKAYDRVEWTFLEKMMVSMGFSVGWINKVMACVKSADSQLQLGCSILREPLDRGSYLALPFPFVYGRAFGFTQ